MGKTNAKAPENRLDRDRASLVKQEQALQEKIQRMGQMLEEAPRRYREEKEVQRRTRPQKLASAKTVAIPRPAPTKRERLSVQIQSEDLEELRRKTQQWHRFQLGLVLASFLGFALWVYLQTR